MVKYKPVIKKPLISWEKFKATHYAYGDACADTLHQIQQKIDKKNKEKTND